MNATMEDLRSHGEFCGLGYREGYSWEYTLGNTEESLTRRLDDEEMIELRIGWEQGVLKANGRYR